MAQAGKNENKGNAAENRQKKIAVIDFETDPFKYGRIPQPFAGGFYDGNEFVCTWGDQCVDELVRVLDSIKTPLLIYAHNGGKFDFHFLLKYIGNPIKIIGSRIVSCSVGIHELRDSYAALPVPLSAYEKTEIDYETFEPETRESHRAAITDYLRDDCVFLHALVSGFIERFGPALTIGSASIKELRKRHPFALQRENHDIKFRRFYFGGRVQCFKVGIFNAPVSIYDVNSMYPAAMKNAIHPTGIKYLTVRGSIMDKRGEIAGLAGAPFYFARVRARVLAGGLPTREKTGLSFPISATEGEFLSTSHELRLLSNMGAIKVSKVIEAHAPYETISFGDFVDCFSAEKISAKKRGDKAAEIFSKLILNSSYGKTSQNPLAYRDYILMRGEIPDDTDYEISADLGEVQIWEKPATHHSYYDVAIGASITSAARATLLRGLVSVTGLYYCDTDSIICEDPGGLDVDQHRLGAWKHEGTGDRIALAGKKLYCVWKAGEAIKYASKGAILSPPDIERVAMGESVIWRNDAPTFSLHKTPSFITREIK